MAGINGLKLNDLHAILKAAGCEFLGTNKRLSDVYSCGNTKIYLPNPTKPVNLTPETSRQILSILEREKNISYSKLSKDFNRIGVTQTIKNLGNYPDKYKADFKDVQVRIPRYDIRDNQRNR